MATLHPDAFQDPLKPEMCFGIMDTVHFLVAMQFLVCVFMCVYVLFFLGPCCVNIFSLLLTVGLYSHIRDYHPVPLV